MKQYISTSQLKDKAKTQLSGKYHGVISACFMVQSLSYIITIFVTDLFPSEGIFWFVVSLLVNVILAAITGVFQTGLSHMFLCIACDRPASGASIFYGFQECYEVSLKVSFVYALLQLICLTPSQILLLFAMETMSTTYIALTLLAYGVGLLIYVPASILISQSYFLILDFPNMKAGEIIRGSIKLMKKHFGRMFYLMMSFLPLTLLCVFTCGIGLLWLIPYKKMTYTYFFLDIMNDKEA